MSGLALGYSRKQASRIPDDAFRFSRYGEGPLGEGGLEEANEVPEMFSDDLYIEDGWRAAGGSGLIGCAFAPYAEGLSRL